MKNTIFTGCGVATVTPMRPDGSVNLKKYAEHIDELIQKGADAIIVNGTTGESATLSDEEQYNIICCAKDVINRRVPLIAGAGSNNARVVAAKAADKLLTIRNIRAAFALILVGSTVNISARSDGSINVQLILEQLGGGGHFDSAGAQVKNTVSREVLEQLRGAIDAYLDGDND